MIISKLAYNCLVEVHQMVGLNGMGQKVYKQMATTTAHYSVKTVREKTKDSETMKTQFTIRTAKPVFNIGDLIVINDIYRAIVSDIKPDDICEVIAYGENPNAF